MASETEEESSSKPRAPRWLRIVTIFAGTMNMVITPAAVISSVGKGVNNPLFYGTVGMIVMLTAVPIWLTFRSGIWLPFYTDEVDIKEIEKKLPPPPPPPPVNPEQVIVSYVDEEAQPLSLKELLNPARYLARKISPRTRVMTLAASAVLALILIFVATFAYPTYAVRPFYDNVMVVIFILALVPPSLLDVVSRAYLKQIDTRIPDFLRDIAESQRTGLPFTKALMNAASTNYGALTKELKRAMAKMSFGFTFEEALDSFADSAETPLAHRAAVLLKEVGRSGGKMLQVLDSVYEHIREVISLQKERSKQLTPYTIVIYASFGVYIFVVYILFSTFFVQVKNLVNSGAPFGTNISPSVYYIWFYHMAVIESVFGGLVAGKISAGSAVAGLKHVLVLLLISFFAFTFFIQV